MQVRYRTRETHKKVKAFYTREIRALEMYRKMLKGSEHLLDRLRNRLALFLMVICLVTFMPLIKKICEQISLIDVVQGVAFWHVSMEVVFQVHNQIMPEGFGLDFFSCNVAVVSEYNEIFLFFFA